MKEQMTEKELCKAKEKYLNEMTARCALAQRRITEKLKSTQQTEALQRIKELESQLAEAKKDQARYQWLDSISSDEWKSLHQISGELLNSYIDAAISSIQEK
jgi:23S rRNA pseudoU1915 N3-methylase RlmH